MGEIEGPFIGTEAVASGLVSRRGLKNDYEAIYRNVYLPRTAELTAVTRARAAWLWAGRAGTLAGLSASAMLGSRWIDAKLPAELVRRGDEAAGVVIHRDALAVDETCVVDGMPCTTAARTAFDLGRRERLTLAVAHLDALSHATGLKRAAVDALIDRHRGARGIVQLRRAIDLVDGASESPQETRTRLLLISRGLPAPQTQIVVADELGRPFARIDMGWEEFKVGVEYDGAQHWTDPAQRSWDIDRWATLEAKGWKIIRVSSDLLRYRPEVIIARTLDALRAAGWTGEIRLDARLQLDRVS